MFRCRQLLLYRYVILNNWLSVVTNMADLYCVVLTSYENVCLQDGDVNTGMSY